ncbi:MAG: DUF4880 domain-containing protein [Verrucomicrobia bacterium]|nr:DUF4880 domain-containing protein [Verrucomicrobiota bacterium]
MAPDPTPPAEDGAALDAIEQIAADWMIRRDRGLTPAQADELERWRRADARHNAVFAALEETWKLMGEARGSPELAVGSECRRPRARTWFTLPAAWVPAGLAAAVALALGGAMAWRAIAPTGHEGRAPFTTTATTEVGAQRALDLPDGSVVHLNTDSRVEIAYTSDQRQVRLLRGEALFEVAKDRSRPFVVSTGSVQVRAVGTAFNVRLRSQAVEVVVTEGSVRVENPATPAAAPVRSSAAPSANLLTAGQKLTVDLTSPATAPSIPVTVTPAAVKRALAWQQQRLEFDSAALPEMVAEFNRYSRHQLVIADPRLEQKRFGGSFPASDHRTFVRLLETHFGVVAESRNGQTQLRLAP